MHYRLYCSSGNMLGLDEYVSYSEIGEDGYFLRYVEIKADGGALRYSIDHSADEFGILPEGRWDDVEARKPEYGAAVAISGQLFEAIWSNTRCVNDGRHD